MQQKRSEAGKGQINAIVLWAQRHNASQRQWQLQTVKTSGVLVDPAHESSKSEQLLPYNLNQQRVLLLNFSGPKILSQDF